MKMVQGTFNGTGAAVYICCGFIPDYVRVQNLEDGIVGGFIQWRRGFRSAEVVEGIFDEADGTACVAKTAGQGIAPFEGSVLLTSSNQTSTAYGEGVYLGWDNEDYRKNLTYGYKTAIIDTWDLDTLGNRTGSFNSDIVASGSRIGEGSVITIKESMGQAIKQAVIEALAASQGVADDEVTLSRALKTGTVERITGMYSMAPIATGKVTPAGFLLSMTSLVNDDNEIQHFEAAKYDD